MIFDAIVVNMHGVLIVQIPEEISETLPSRGAVMMKGLLKNTPIHVLLEPDGKGFHWFEIPTASVETHTLHEGVTLKLDLSPTDDWFDPTLPADLNESLLEAHLMQTWIELTPKAKWDWVRWIQFTKNPETRQRRIHIACSKLEKGDKRPCCFDRTRCTLTEVCKSGVLKD